MPPKPFDDAEGKLDFGAQAELLLVAMVLSGREFLAAIGFVVDQIDQAGLAAAGLEPLVGVGAVADDDFLLAVGAFAEDLAVMYAGGGGAHGVHQAAFGVDANVGFHAEVSVAVLLSGTHLGIAFAGLIFGATGRGKDRGVYHRASFHQQALGGQLRIDLGEDGLG